MKAKSFWENEKIQIFICMFISMFFYAFHISKAVPLHTSSDELGTIVSAAYLAGRNWKGVIDISGYYGFGFFLQFFWVFKLTDNPYHIYQIIMLFCALERVLIIPIVYRVAKKYLNVESNSFALILAIVMSFLHTQRVVTMANEYSIELIIWINVLLMCKLAEVNITHMQRTKYTFGLVIVLAYSQTIHTRMLVMLIADFIIILLFQIIYKRRLINWMVIFWGIIIILFVKYGISVYQNSIWSNTGEGLRNASVSISSKIDFLNLNTWQAWLHMLLGMINSMTLSYGGIFLVGVVTFFGYVVACIKRKDITNLNINIIFLFSVLCMGATILAFLVSSFGEGIILSWAEKGAKNVYSYKGLTYIRYWEPYVSPFILVAIVIIYKNLIRKIDVIKITGIIYILLQCAFIAWVLPLIQNNTDALSPLRGLSMYNFGESVSINNYYIVILIATAFFIVSMLLLAIGRVKWSLLAVLGIIVFQYSYSFFNYDIVVQKRIESKVDASYKQLKSMELAGEDIENIYVIESNEKQDHNWKMYSVTQFYLNQYTIHKEKPICLDINNIVITNSTEKINFENDNEIESWILDENEVWYVNKINNWHLVGDESDSK